jgi:cytochrome c5
MFNPRPLWSALFALPLALAAGASSATQDRMEEGKAAYSANCAKCHDTGVMGAPITGETADWEERSELWEGVLMEHANRGWLKMPAKGGNDAMTEYDVDAAAEYMLTTSHPKLLAD